jgi:transcriptional regulator with XRE-family HTH domain
LDLLSESDISRLPVHQRIRYARLSAGLSAVELAEMTGTYKSALSRYEMGKTTLQGMDVELLGRIAVACNRDKHFCMDEYHIFKADSDVYLREYMERNGLTNSGLAELLGVSETTVKNWKRGKACPSYELWTKFFKKT